MTARIRYQGDDGVYALFLDDQRVGMVTQGFKSWQATSRQPTGWLVQAPTRRDATEGLLRLIGKLP